MRYAISCIVNFLQQRHCNSRSWRQILPRLNLQLQRQPERF
jgi:hypothetical protein